MEEIIRYLELKNQYYEKFLSISKKFLSRTEEKQWDDLPLLVDNRERILNIIRSYDFKIAKCFEDLDPAACDLASYRSRVKMLLAQRTELVNKIVAVDLELISKIDELKSETIRELKKTVETNQVLDSFSASAAAVSSTNPRPVKTA